MIGLKHITATPPGTFAGNVEWFTVKHPDYAPHDLVDPSTHEHIQFVPYDQPSKALRNLDGGVETNNRPGGVYQIEIVAEYECGGYNDDWYGWLEDFLEAKSDELGIAHIFHDDTHRFSFDEWYSPTLEGWYKHCNVPENDHPCSKQLDITRLEAMTPQAWCRMRDPGFETPDALYRVVNGVIQIKLADGDWYWAAQYDQYVHTEASRRA